MRCGRVNVQVLEGVKSCECFGLHLTNDIAGKNPTVGERSLITSPSPTTGHNCLQIRYHVIRCSITPPKCKIHAT